jgi:hypothetical protein
MVRDLIVLTATIAGGFLLAVAFYESLSTRYVLVGGTTRMARRITRSRLGTAIAYGLAVFVLIPVLVALWAIVLEVVLGVVVPSDGLRVAESAVAIVGAARVLAYVREKRHTSWRRRSRSRWPLRC